jgi:hypothetical protein
VNARRSGKDHHVFHLGPREKDLLFQTIKLYPLVPASHYQLSKSKNAAQSDENQRLLDESLAEQRQQNRKQVLELLNDPQRLRETKSGFELKLAPTQMEWLLQVLNDVRVGSWLSLGEPEPGKEPELTEQNARFLLAMELCGAFESMLLAALGIRESPGWMNG